MSSVAIVYRRTFHGQVTLRSGVQGASYATSAPHFGFHGAAAAACLIKRAGRAQAFHIHGDGAQQSAQRGLFTVSPGPDRPALCRRRDCRPYRIVGSSPEPPDYPHRLPDYTVPGRQDLLRNRRIIGVVRIFSGTGIILTAAGIIVRIGRIVGIPAGCRDYPYPSRHRVVGISAGTPESPPDLRARLYYPPPDGSPSDGEPAYMPRTP